MGGGGSSAPPPWEGLKGERRIASELKFLSKQIRGGHLPQVSGLTTVDDQLSVWRLELKGFDDSTRGGRQLNADLRALAQRFRQDHILMEVRFPRDYPTTPFFMRVVRPRMEWYTGHVTAGGSICIEALNLTGSPGGWQPGYCVDSLLQLVIANMVDCEVVHVRTPTGPGGISGPLRVDLQCKYCHSPMQEYGLVEAQAAFERTAQNHRQSGWGSLPQPRVLAAAAAAALGAAGASSFAPAASLGAGAASSSSSATSRFGFIIGSAPGGGSSSGGGDGSGGTAATTGPSQPEGAPSSPPRPSRMPAHWDLTDNMEHCGVDFISLPLPHFPESAISMAAIREVTEQGLSIRDAIILLQQTRGDPEAALLAAAAGRSMGRDAVRAAVDMGLQQSPAALEAEAVLAEFHKFSNASCYEVVRIERVQHLELWRDYQEYTWQLAAECRDGHPSERVLFHGSSKASIASITERGFDLSYCRQNCALGRGLYLSSASAISASYSSWKEKAHGLLALAPALPVALLSRDPGWQPGCHAMLLCAVALGEMATEGDQIQAARAGRYSVLAGTHAASLAHELGQTIAVYSSRQAYPAYIVSFRTLSHGAKPPYLPPKQLVLPGRAGALERLLAASPAAGQERAANSEEWAAVGAAQVAPPLAVAARVQHGAQYTVQWVLQPPAQTATAPAPAPPPPDRGICWRRVLVYGLSGAASMAAGSLLLETVGAAAAAFAAGLIKRLTRG